MNKRVTSYSLKTGAATVSEDLAVTHAGEQGRGASIKMVKQILALQIAVMHQLCWFKTTQGHPNSSDKGIKGPELASFCNGFHHED